MNVFRSLAVLLLVSACGPAGLLDTLTPDYGVVRTDSVAYAPGPRGMLDIYRPSDAGPGKLPVIVFLYGGNWQMGSKEMYRFAGRPLAARGAPGGAIVVVPDYRLAPEVQFPDFVRDNAAAVRWTLAHLEALGGDPGRVFVLGHSAGAYNAAMLALDPAYLGAERGRLAGVIALAGPFDFLPITQPDLQPIFAPVQDGPLSQPITYADGTNPPMLLLAGADDTTVRPGNTQRLAARIAERGGIVESRIYPGLAHIGILTALTPLFAARAPVLEDIAGFIAAHPRANAGGQLPVGARG